MYPDDCIQHIVGDWWIKNEERSLCRGALILAFVPHVDQVPYTFSPVGRTDAGRHKDAIVRVEPLKVEQALKQTDLPVAAMPLNYGEVWAAYRAKKRPCIVMGTPGVEVERSLVKGMSKTATSPTMLVVPSYGVPRSENRAGYPPAFVERVRQLEYPRFFWDRLPDSGDTSESILRLDHLQPVGTHYASYKVLGWKLSPDALEVMDDLLKLQIWGGVQPNSLVKAFRESIEEMFK